MASISSTSNKPFPAVIVMLVLSRNTGERIHIGEDITIEVCRIEGNRVALALKAPPSVRILRGELLPALDSAMPTYRQVGGLSR